MKKINILVFFSIFATCSFVISAESNEVNLISAGNIKPISNASSTPDLSNHIEKELSQKEAMAFEESVKKILADKMKDPLSVQFRNIRQDRVGPKMATRLCGEFNAKNSYGAYTGFKYFAAIYNEKITVFFQGFDKNLDFMPVSICNTKGV